MAENQIITEVHFKQPRLAKHFMHVIANHQLTHAYLFSGESGTGKLPMALLIAMRLFCNHVHNNFPCGRCNECRRITNHQHPDIAIIKPRGQKIKIDQIRFLRAEFAKSAVEGNQKIFIIVGADRMTISAANSLLKFIEEPVGNVVSFLLTTDKTAILPTIVSRTQVIEFRSLNPEAFSRELKHAGLNPNQYHLLATMTNNLATAKKWNVNHWFGHLQAAVEQWFSQLASGSMTAFPMVQTRMMPLINNRQDRQIALNMLIQIWRDVMNVKFESIPRSKLSFPNAISKIKALAQRITAEQLLKIIDLMLNTQKLLNRNVNFQNILELTTLAALKQLR